MIVISDEHARVEVHAADGAAIGRYDLIGRNGELLPIFQTAPTPGRKGPYVHGLNLLVPFSNRISGGGFSHDGSFYPLERNTAGPYPIHGNAFLLPWTVTEAGPRGAVLSLSSDGPGAFRYDATVAYDLADGALSVKLTLVNRAPRSLPYGAGFHPWFVRTPDARLTMRAAGYWTETADHLPDRYLPAAGDARFDFAGGRELPHDPFNNALTGWDGRATLAWPARRLAVDILTPPPLTTAILYSPAAGSDFVCIEPVSHSVDAHNRRDPGSTPPQVLQPGEALVVEASFRPQTLER
jgi:aldose 1-epimerase